MSTLVTRPAPQFEAEAVLADGSFANVKLSDYKGKYVVLYFYPLDFTFVCPSEILAFNKKVQEFQDRLYKQPLEEFWTSNNERLSRFR